MGVILQLVPESIRYRLAIYLIDADEHCLLACVEYEGHVAHEHYHEGNLTDVGLPEAFVRVIIVPSTADVEEDLRFKR